MNDFLHGNYCTIYICPSRGAKAQRETRAHYREPFRDF